MNKYVSLLICSLLSTMYFLSLTPKPAMSSACETRAVWVNAQAFTTTELNKAQSARLNTLFVIAPPIGGNYGEGNAAAFISFIKQAKARGFSVHAWMLNGLRVGGSFGGVDFTSPTEQGKQAAWAISLLDAYGEYLDGIHLDYIRYDVWEDVNINNRMNGVSVTVQKIHTAIKSKYPGKMLTAAVFPLEPAYADFDQEGLSQWYRNWFAAHPGNWYDVAYPDFDTVPSEMKYQQNPVAWARSGNIEGFIPMAYGMKDAVWKKQASALKSFLTYNGNWLHTGLMGLGWLTESGQPDWGHDAPGIVRKIKYGRSIGITGFSIFEFGQPGVDDRPLISALSVDGPDNGNAAPFKLKAPSCLVP